MFTAKIRPVAFTEHPVTDLHSTKAGNLDVLIDLGATNTYSQIEPSPVESYCLALLQKICTLENEQLRAFIAYQQDLMKQPAHWLTNLDKLILTNAQVFENKILALKAEKTLVLIEFALQALNSSGYKNNWDFEQVRLKLKGIPAIEDQLVFLYNLKAEYLQSGPVYNNPHDIPFDEKILIEIKKIHELQEAIDKVKTKRGSKSYFADVPLDNEEFIIMMKISKRTAQTWRDEGIIPYIQICSKIYYFLSDVETLLKSRYVRSLKSRERLSQ